MCGFQMPIEGVSDRNSSQPVEANRGGALPPDKTDDREELPEWRQELTRRLQEIKAKREGFIGSTQVPDQDTQPLTLADQAQERTEAEVPLLRPPRPRKPRRTIPAGDVLPDSSAGAVPAAHTPAMPKESMDWRISEVERGTGGLPAADVVIRPSASAADSSRRRDSQVLIDTVMAKQPVEKHGAGPAAGIETQNAVGGEPRNDKLILMSRTLAGMVDLIIVGVSASSLVFAVDVFEGIEVFDAVSIVHYIMLLLMTYFLYSFFFLGTAGQTVGMMLTDLKITGSSFKTPRASQILVRCLAYLLGTAGLGLGLIWGCFDRQAMCLHDRLSRTQVTRIPFY